MLAEAIPWPNVLLSLLIRFVGVFLILGVMQIAMYVSGAILSRLASPPGKRP